MRDYTTIARLAKPTDIGVNAMAILIDSKGFALPLIRAGGLVGTAIIKMELKRTEIRAICVPKGGAYIFFLSKECVGHTKGDNVMKNRPKSNLLRRYRRLQDYSQKQLATVIGSKQQYISFWERGERVISEKMKVEVANALQLPITVIFPNG